MTISNGAPCGEVPGLNTHITVNLAVGAALAGIVLFVPVIWPDWAKWLLAGLAATWLFMVVASAPSASGSPLAARLLRSADRESRYDQWLTPLLIRTAAWLRIDTAPPLRPGRVLRQTLDWRLIDAAMLLAVVYPLGLLLLHWAATGADGRLGPLVVLPAEGRIWLRISFLISLIFAILSARQAFENRRKSHPVIPWLLLMTLSSGLSMLAASLSGTRTGLIFSFTVVFLSFMGFGSSNQTKREGKAAPGGAAAAGLLIAISMIYIFQAAQQQPFTITISVRFFVPAFVFMFVTIGVSRWISFGKLPPQVLYLYVCALAFIILFTPILLPLPVDPNFLGIFIFVTLFPIVNALFDFLSLGATLTFMRLGQAGGGWTAAGCGALDLIIALLLFWMSGCAMIAGVHTMNGLAGQTLVDLPLLFAEIAAAPGSYWWLFAMLFSTVLPTLAHVVMALLALVTLKPGRLAEPALWLMARASEGWAIVLAPVALTALAVVRLAGWAVALGLLAFALSGLSDWAFDWHPNLAEAGRDGLHAYLSVFRRFALWIGALPPGQVGA